MNISVKTVFSKGRVENFYKFHMMRMDKFRFLHYAFIIASLIAIVLLATVFDNYAHASTIIVILIIMTITLIVSRPYRIYRAYKKIITKSPLIDKSFIVTFHDEGIDYEMDSNIQKFKWEDILTIREIVDSLYIYVSDVKAIIVPKYLIEREERIKLIEFIKTKTLYKKHKFGQIAGE